MSIKKLKEEISSLRLEVVSTSKDIMDLPNVNDTALDEMIKKLMRISKEHNEKSIEDLTNALIDLGELDDARIKRITLAIQDLFEGQNKFLYVTLSTVEKLIDQLIEDQQKQSTKPAWFYFLPEGNSKTILYMVGAIISMILVIVGLIKMDEITTEKALKHTKELVKDVK